MKYRRIFTILLLLLIFIPLAGCDMEGGYSGSVSNSSQSSQIRGERGECEGSIGKLKGTYEIDVPSNSWDKSGIELDIAIEQGTMSVWIETIKGDIVKADVSPGNPAYLTGIVETDTDFDDEGYFSFMIEATSEEVIGITYSVIHRNLD